MWHICCKKLPFRRAWCGSYKTNFYPKEEKNAGFGQWMGAIAGKCFCRKWQSAVVKVGLIFPYCTCLGSLGQWSSSCLHQSESQCLKALFLVDPGDLSLEISLGWSRKNWQTLMNHPCPNKPVHCPDTSSVSSYALLPGECGSNALHLHLASHHTLFLPNCLISAMVHKKIAPLWKAHTVKCLEGLKISRQRRVWGAGPGEPS